MIFAAVPGDRAIRPPRPAPISPTTGRWTGVSSRRADHVGVRHGVAVHAGVVEAGQRDRGGDVLGQGEARAPPSGPAGSRAAARPSPRSARRGRGPAAGQPSGLQHRRGLDALGGRRLDLDVAHDAARPRPKVTSPSMTSDVASAQRRRAFGEALVEVADELVEVAVEIDERHARRSPGRARSPDRGRRCRSAARAGRWSS